MDNRTGRQERAPVLHGHGKARKLVRRLTPREVAELRGRDVPQPGDRRRRDGIKELRRAISGTYRCEEVANG